MVSLCGTIAHASSLPPAQQHGVDWLAAQVHSDGSLAGETGSIGTSLQAREESLVTLNGLSSAPSSLVANVATAATGNTEYVARQIIAAGSAHQNASDDVATLLALQNSDGGWGLAIDYASDALDTALALQALLAVNAPSPAVTNGLAFLADVKQTDGGWGVGDRSSVYTTANVLLAVTSWTTQYPDNADISTAATNWLLAARGSAQDYGNTFDDAYGLIALASESGQSAALSPLMSALSAQQLSDGSWSDDPYLTALALRGLWYANQPPINPTNGNVNGIVVDQSTNQPLAGAAIQLAENAGFSATTANDGSFHLVAVPAGTYTLQASHSGYQTRSLSIQIVAGQTLNITSIALSPVSTTANLSGVVKDNTGKLLQNVIIAVGTKSTLTDAAGSYQLSGLTPGAATITASLSGYATVSANATFVAGTSYVFSPTLYPTNTTPPPTSFQGIVVDATTNLPIVGASVVLNGATKATDVSGAFIFSNVTKGSFLVTISANGYQTAMLTVSLVAGVNDVGTITLQPSAATTTLQGKVLDSEGHTIANATVAVDQGPTATSDNTGAYQLSNLSGTQFLIQVSAAGFVTQAFTLTITTPGGYTQDFHLVAQQTNQVTLGALTVAPASGGANTDLSVSSTLVNGGSAQFDGVLLLEVYDAENNRIGSGPLTDVDGFTIGAVSLQPGGSLGIIGRWNTGQFAPGTYQFEMRLVEPGSINRSNPLGTLIQDQFAGFTITPTTHFTGTVAANPPVIQAGLNQPMDITAVVRNDGNLEFAAQAMTLTVADAQGAVAFSTSANLDAIAPNGLANLDFGNWVPTAGGNYQLIVTAADITQGKLTGSAFVGNVAQATFTATPDTVIAGTRVVHGNIHVAGVNPAQATITDPLAPLIKAAIQRAVTFNDSAARTWIESNRCSSCHIGNQALIGGELTRDLSTYNAFSRNVILNNISTNQSPGGGIWEGYSTGGTYGRRLGTLSLWGLSGYHNLQEFVTVIKHAADWVTGFQSANGQWSSDYNSAWFDNDISMSMLNLSNLRHAHELLQSDSITTVPTYTTQPFVTNEPVNSRAFMIVSSSGNLYYSDRSDSAVHLIKPDGTLITRWTGFNDPRCVVERKDGQVWLSTGNGTYRLNPDGTSTRLAPDTFNSLELGPDGTVWGVIYPSNTIYQLDDNATAHVWLSNGPFSSMVFVNPDADGSLYVTDRNYGRIYHVLPDKSVTVAAELMQGPGSQPALVQLMRDGDHWLLSTTNGIYRLSADWEAQRLTWSSEVDQMARLADGTVVYVGYGSKGIQKLVQQTEEVAPSLTKYENAINLGANWLQAQSIAASDSLHMAQQLWGLGEAYRFYQGTDSARAASIKTAMTTLATRLRANQKANGSWGRATNYANGDALVTAQVGIALDYLDPSASDPAIRKAVAWLLTQQQADGSWVSADGIMSTHESTTTMVAIWLPMILDRLGAIDAQVSATFPPNIQAADMVPAPDQSSTDGAGNVSATWHLTGVTNTGRDLDFDLTLDDMLPNEVRPVATDAHMTFLNSFTQLPIDVPIAIPNVTANPPVSLSVITDQPAYPHNATAQVTTTLVSLDDVEVDGTLVVNVYDAAGALVGEVTQQGVAIPAGGTLPITGPFAIGTITPATYTVKAVLSDGAIILAQGQTTFDVLPDNSTGTATSTLHTDKQVYNPSDQVKILSGVQSLSSNAILSNLTLHLQVVDSNGVVQFTHGIAIPQLLASQTLNFTTPQQLSNAAAGVYTVKQDLLDAQNNLFNHVETTYTVSSTSDTGFGLTGTIAVTPKTLPVGATLTLAATATDQGNSALSNLPLTITVVDPGTGAALAQFNQTSTIAVGATVPFDTSWVTQGTANTTYLAVLTATVGSGPTAHTITLATDTFQLTLSLKADVTLTATPPPLAALVLFDPNVTASEASRVTAELGALGYTATFVYSASDFATGVRTGAYQLYLLLAAQVQPDATTQRLLREAVHRGEGLITANGMANLPDALAQTTGLQSGALPVINAQAIDVLASAPGGAAHVDLNPSLASRIVVPQGAQTQATLTGRLPAVPDQGTLSDEVVALGRVDIGYFGTDAGTNSSQLSLTSVGRIHNPDGTDEYSVWLIRNSGTTPRNVTLTSVAGGYSLAIAITPQTDTFIASPIVAGTADHRLRENNSLIQTVSALTSVFSDTRLVDVGANPGAIALWANALSLTDVFGWTGAQHQVHGAIHSNSDLRLSGAQNLLDGPVHYVSTFTNTGSQNSFTFQPRQVTAQPLPTLLNLADFAPGGAVATAAGAQYFDQSAECAAKPKWHRTPSDMPLPTGVYYIPCDVQIDGDSPSGTVSLVSTGAIQITGSKGVFQPFYQGVQFATSQAGASAIQLSGSNTQVGGLVFAPNGTIQASGDAMVFSCSVIGDKIRFAGSKTIIDVRTCPYATVQERTPAVLWSAFGSGRAGYAAFDWQGAISQYEATPGVLTNLFAGVLNHVAPTSNPLRAGSIVPLTSTVQNLADPFTGTLKLSVNDDSTFVPPTTTWMLDFTNTSSFTANPNVRLGSGTSTDVTATVAAATPVVMDPLKQTSTTIAHLSGETIADVISAISAVSSPDGGLTAALVDLQAAQDALTANDTSSELTHLLDAAEACGQSTNAQADALRTRIDWLVWASTH